MQERRRDERVPLPLEVAWETDSGEYRSGISDLSLSGCYIQSIAQVAVGERIHFQIETPTGRWLPLSGVVMYHHPQIGFGVHFATLTDRVRNVLTGLIEYARTG